MAKTYPYKWQQMVQLGCLVTSHVTRNYFILSSIIQYARHILVAKIFSSLASISPSLQQCQVHYYTSLESQKTDDPDLVPQISFPGMLLKIFHNQHSKNINYHDGLLLQKNILAILKPSYPLLCTGWVPQWISDKNLIIAFFENKKCTLGKISKIQYSRISGIWKLK